MKINKILNEYSKNSYNDYYYDMYGYNKNKEKEDKVKEEVEKEDTKIASIIDEYLDDIYTVSRSRLVSKYKEAITKVPKDDSKIEGIERDLEHMITTPLLKLKRNRKAYKKAIDDDIIYDFDKFKNEFVTPLTESFLNKDEENLIFGSLSESIQNTLELEEAQKVTNGNVNQAIKNAQHAVKDVKEKKGDVRLANMAVMHAKNTYIDKTQDDINERNQKDSLAGKKDGVAGVSITEANENLKNNKEIISTSKNVKDVLKKEDIESLDEGFARVSPDLREEKMTSKNLRDEKKISKDLRDEKTTNKRQISQYDTMLYNGASGEVLKYMIKGEINNNNVEVLEISKLVEKDNEAQIVLKKIKALLNKASKKDLSYEEYTQLKVLKSQFKSIFTKFKNQYNNRYKN